jgi:hypothetical protein
MVISKKSKKLFLTGLLAFAAIFVGFLSFVYQGTSNAADISKFNPGNIISDAVMSNKKAMSVQQIQTFLNSKNACNNTNTHMATWYPSFSYNIKDGKFVCMAKDSFNGQSAAQIIWQTAQDYSINPQVLIVLLEKEQGLVSDTWPNNVQYRTATGFGCPDTAPCDSQYYGLKNQLRQAANLFRNVLNGGWSNYPVGKTYVQYNPNADCGGSIINIQNRSTSALYRYTPYQPNQSALNAGYGLGNSCGAYGNRNFWMLFTDWFGSTQKDIFLNMEVGRKLVAKDMVNKINPATGESISGQTINSGQVVKYNSKTHTLDDNKLCLRTESNTKTNEIMCVPYDNLEEGPSFSNLANTTKLVANEDVAKIDPIDSSPVPGQTIDEKQIIEYTSQTTTRLDGKACLRTKANTASDLVACVPRDKLSEIPSFSSLSSPRLLVAKNTVQKIDPYSELPIANQIVYRGMLIKFSSQINTLKSNTVCLRTTSNTQTNSNICIPSSDFKEYINPNFTNMDIARSLKTNKATMKIDPVTGEKVEDLPSKLQIIFSQKTYHNGSLCLRTKTDTSLNKQACVLYSNLVEL